jgi:hypothetical protein
MMSQVEAMPNLSILSDIYGTAGAINPGDPRYLVVLPGSMGWLQ